MKKFVPPLLNRKPSSDKPLYEPPIKKQKTEVISTFSRSFQRIPSGSSANKRPSLSVGDARNSRTSTTTSVPTSGEAYYNVLWRKFTTKKHKTFDGDGVLVVSEGYAVLRDQSGKDMGRTMLSKKLEEGDMISVGQKEVQIDSVLSKADYLAARPTLRASTVADPEPATSMGLPAAMRGGFKTPLLSTTSLQRKGSKVPVARHNPKAENALVLPRPSQGAAPAGKNIVDVVVDPYLSQHLRPHQREGVQFMYECVMGMKQFEGRGAILADEMGLGKTLQTIALLWTLLKQNPIYGDPPVIKKALIVCPVTLINNWRKEFRKWLGNERIGVFVADSKANLRDFTAGKVYTTMIIGYEKLQRVHTELKKANIDIIIADEGHRLKTESNKAAQAIRELNTSRRIILSGTPLQNDLHEFFTMVDLVNPELLGTYSAFRRSFENPIIRSRQPLASKKDKDLGEAQSAELAKITGMFVLRRTAEILSDFLPPKKEYILYCRPTSGQLHAYKAMLESSAFQSFLGSPDLSLLLITLLKKLCNSPGLLDSGVKEQSDRAKDILAEVSPRLLALKGANSSGKMRVLDRLLCAIREKTEEKVVLVSNYTSTLDMLQHLLSARGMSFLRLDGTTPNDKRQPLVDRFNRVNQSEGFAFLLSAKSGGTGINLIGASRLILFDLDWNPATDAQAMARIHRDGQKRPVMIYRMLTTGCLDEKIFQRQITKQGLADSVMDKRGGASAFTLEELRDLFKLDEDTDCQTHDLCCSCEGSGYPPSETETPAEINLELSDDESSSCPPLKDIYKTVVAGGLIKASQATADIISGKVARFENGGKQALKGALMQYSHVLTDRLDEEDIVLDDEILMDVLKEPGKTREVSYVFQKNS